MQRDKTAYDFDSDIDYELYLANLNPDSHFKNEMNQLKNDFRDHFLEMMDKYEFQEGYGDKDEVLDLLDEFIYELSKLKAEKVLDL